MSALTEASLIPLLDLLSVKGGDTSGTAGSIVGHVTAEPSIAPLLCHKLGEQVVDVAVPLHVPHFSLCKVPNDCSPTYPT